MKKLFAIALSLAALPSYAATCKISEYSNMAVDEGGRVVPVAQEPAVAVQEVTYTTSAQSSAFNASTRFIRIVCDAKAHFEFGTNPTAAATDPYLAPDAPEYFAVPRGSAYEVAFYDGSS
jgi:hypothetical protein